MSTVYGEEQAGRPLHSGEPVRSPFWPVLVIILAVTGWFAFQTFQLWQEHRGLVATGVTQDNPFAESQKVRDSLDSLARQIVTLADGGNANARLVIDELKRRGITINPTPPPPQAPSTPDK